MYFQKKYVFLKHFLFLLLLSSNLFSQSLAKYEPPNGRIIHSLGQYTSYFYTKYENWQMVDQYQNGINKIPMIYSVYAGIDPILCALDSTDFEDITTNHGYPYVLMVGLILFDSSYLITGTYNIPVQNIINGVLDSQILNVAQRIKNVGAPVYLRPGFEFGSGNSGIHNDPDVGPTEFISIWEHIYDIFTQQNVTNVAWVWNTVNPNSFNYMEWYPGDIYVDWWGINYFTLGQINNGDVFLNDAAAHGKPVMICESCPIQSGGTTNLSNWNNWFVPYFSKIKNTPHIKGFIYIHDPWDRGPFSSWPDSRITSNPTIQNNYASELNDSIYINMDEYLANPNIIGIGDTIPPSPVSNFTADPENRQISLIWINPIEPDLYGIKILRKTSQFPQNPFDGILVFDGIDTTFTDTSLVNDTTYYYAAFAYDTVMNYSIPANISGTPFAPNKILKKKQNKLHLNNFEIFPNPFNSSTNVKYSIIKKEFVVLKIFDVLGREILSFEEGIKKPGSYSFQLNFAALSSGIYIFQISGTSFVASRKILVIR